MTIRRLLFIATVALFASFATAAPAWAHAALLFTSPAADSAVTASPKQVTLVFGEAVSVTRTAVTLVAADGHSLPVGSPGLSAQNRVISVSVLAVLRPGIYHVRWIVTAADGDLVDGSFRFGVGDAPNTGEAVASTPWERTGATMLLRWALFAGLALGIGGLVGEQLVRRKLGSAKPAWLVPGALVVAIAAVLLGVALIAQTGMQALSGSAGQILIIDAAAGLIAAGLGATRWRIWALIPLAVVVVAEGDRSHVHEAGGLGGALLTAVHLTAAALWVGALVHVLREARSLRQQSKLVRQVLTGYAWMALGAFLVVAVTGTLAAVLVVDLGDLISTRYGQVLLIKLALVVLVAALALTARIRLGFGAARTAIRPARAELLGLVVVLGVTGLLVSLAPPSAARAALPFAPPALGVTVPVAARAGQVGVAVRASDGQLVVQLTAPGADTETPGVAPPPTPGYGLSATLAEPGQAAASPLLRGCGSGCFVAPINWRNGDSRLTLAVTASGWTGGFVSLLIPWPGRSDPALLAQVTHAMAKVVSLTVYETVTSDTSRPNPQAVGGISLTGRQFIGSEPYSTGLAPIATVVETAPGRRRLLLAYPADQYTVDLTVDGHGRIVYETLTTANHLVTRTLVYPEAQP